MSTRGTKQLAFQDRYDEPDEMKPRFDIHLPFLGLRGKLLIAFVGLSLGPLALMGVYGVASVSESLTDANTDHLRLELLSNARHVESYRARLAAEATMLSERVTESGLLDYTETAPRAKIALGRVFIQLGQLRPDYYQIRVLDMRGEELVRVNRSGDTLHFVAERDLQNKGKRYYFNEAMRLPTSKTYFSPIDLNIERGGTEDPQRLVFRVAHKVVDGRGRVRGLLVLNIFADDLLGRLELLRPEPQARVLLVGRDGRFVYGDCSGQPCRYEFGDVRAVLRGFAPGTVQRLMAGEMALMVEGPEHFLSHTPIRSEGVASDDDLQLAILYPRDLVMAPVKRMRNLFLVFGALVGAVALLLAILGARSLSDPIMRILHFVRGVADGDFDQPLEVETRDEIEQLAAGVRDTARALETASSRLLGWNEELQKEVAAQVHEIEALHDNKHAMDRQLRQADRLASLGLLSASVAHEIGNPLASMKTVIQVHLKNPSVPESTRKALDLVISEVNRLGEILDRIRGYARPPRGEKVMVCLRDVYERVLLLVEREAQLEGIALELTGDGIDESIAAQGNQLEQVLLNLIVNAMQAMDHAGRVTVDGHLVAGELHLSVTDTGPGIPEEMRERVFDPFLTTKDGGTGLGLPIVRQSVGEMGGTVSIETAPGGGALLRVVLPLGDEEVPRLATEVPA